MAVRNLPGSTFESPLVGTTVKGIFKDSDGYLLFARGTGAAPTTAEIFSPGALYIRYDASAGTKKLYENIGSTAVPNWNLVGDVTAGEIALADGTVLVGNSSGVAAAVTLSGDFTITNAGVATLGVSFPRTVSVALTNAEIKALRATPKQLVAAPGAGFYLEFISATLFLDAGANVLTESTANLGIKYTDGSGVQVNETVEATGFIDQAGDTATNARPKLDAIVAKAGCENKALVLHNLGGGEYAGNAAADATLRVKISYRVHTTGW